MMSILKAGGFLGQRRTQGRIQRTSLWVSWPIDQILCQTALPGDLGLCLRHKIVAYRNKGDSLNIQDYDHLVLAGAQTVFVRFSDLSAFENWSDVLNRPEPLADTPEKESLSKSSQALRRGVLEIFHRGVTNELTELAVKHTKKVVSDFLKNPYVVSNLKLIQKFDRGVVDHSVNVSLLSVFLGLHMGYSSQVILEHLAMGGLLHDVGKTKNIDLETSRDLEALPATGNLYEAHPRDGVEILERQEKIPREVLLIVSQHHEYQDGSGFPKKLRGLAIYDLARLVCIANVFDHLVTDSKAPTSRERFEDAMYHLSVTYKDKLDFKKLEKTLKILEQCLPPS